MSRSLNPQQTPTFIPHLQGPNGETISSPSLIMKTFGDFYQSLYNVSPHQSISLSVTNEDNPASCVADTPLSTLDADTIEELEAPFTEEEVAKAIAINPAGKSPGPDAL